MQLRLAGPGGRVPPPSSRRRTLRVLAEEGHSLHPHRERPRASPRRTPSPSPTSSHLVPRCLRPQREPPAPRHSANPAASADAQPSASGGSSPETEAAPPELGPASPTHLRHGRSGVPMRRQALHPCGPLDAQAGRGTSHRARCRASLTGAASCHCATPVAPRYVTVSEALHADEGPSRPASADRACRQQETGSLGSLHQPCRPLATPHARPRPPTPRSQTAG